MKRQFGQRDEPITLSRPDTEILIFLPVKTLAEACVAKRPSHTVRLLACCFIMDVLVLLCHFRNSVAEARKQSKAVGKRAVRYGHVWYGTFNRWVGRSEVGRLLL
jgi:hypothetical protein